MADTDGQNADNLVARLKRFGSRYSFFQSARILLQRARAGKLAKVANFRPSLSFSRPRSEIVDVVESDEKITVDVNVPGLYGASSPLPRFYTEELILAGQDDQPYAREFLDIFHARYYELHFSAQLKYQSFVRETDFSESDVTQLLTTFVGNNLDKVDNEVAHRLLPYLALFSPFRRSASGLEVLLNGLFPAVKFSVIEHIHKRMFTDDSEVLVLGRRNHCLGDSALLGNFIEIENCSIRIDIGPIDIQSYQEIVEGAGVWLHLRQIIEAYCSASVAIDLQINLEDNRAKPVTLGGDNGPCLGLSTWLLHSEGKAKFSSNIPLQKAG